MKGKKLELEPHNFRVNSDGWCKITVGGEEYLVNPQGDIWQIIGEEADGEQLFTWNAAMRETKKAGKRMPADEEFSKILKTEKDMPNLILAGYRLAGYRSTDGSFHNRLAYAYFWSSLQYDASSAWRRALYSGASTVYRHYDYKAYGFSVRCLKD
ncbi:MAG: FISUMP domain-containing protein [Minisyncoccia bacterium]